MKIYVKDWIQYSKATNFKEAPCGGSGGWFNFKESGQRWRNYTDIWKSIAIPYIEAIRISVIKKNLRFTGAGHQSFNNGVPLFSDNTVGLFSFRAWGDIMAAIWSEEGNKDYSYLDFYM